MEIGRWRLETENKIHRRMAAERGHPQAIGVSRFAFPTRPIFNLQPLSLQKLEIGRWRLETENKISRRMAAERGRPQTMGVFRSHFWLALCLISNIRFPIFNFQPPPLTSNVRPLTSEFAIEIEACFCSVQLGEAAAFLLNQVVFDAASAFRSLEDGFPVGYAFAEQHGVAFSRIG